MNLTSGYVTVGEAKIYYETAGEGPPFVMIHAGVADRRQWNREFAHFANQYRVIRYDMRGYGKSEPVAGDYSHLTDLTALLDHLDIPQPAIMMGCSMGGGLAMDFAIAHSSRVKAVIMVDSAPTGLELDVPREPIFDEVEKAYNEGKLERVAELETHIWFDGLGRTPQQTNQRMRALAEQMNRQALTHEAKNLGNRLADSELPGAQQVDKIRVPVLVIVGDQDNNYILAAADWMVANIPTARMVVIQDAAHLPNMDHPERFQQIVTEFLQHLD